MNTSQHLPDAGDDPHDQPEFLQQVEAQFDAARAQFDAVNEKIEKRVGRNLFAAIGVGVALGGIFVASLVIFKPLFLVICVAAAFFAALELARALRTDGVYVPRIGAGVTSAIIPIVAYFWGGVGIAITLVVSVVALLIWYLIEHRWGKTYAAHAPTRISIDLLSCAGVVVYVGGLISFAAALVALYGGEWWVLGFIVIVVANDTGAYAAGLLWGKHPMAPRISPKKSWEGFAGGMTAALIAGVLISWLMLHQPWWFGLVLGVVFTASGVAGDLVESTIKRRIGVKDMSSWLPGHGGILDRLDSIMLTAPFAYAIALLAL